MDRKTHNRLIQAARKISMSWKPRLAAKAKCKIDKALYQCELCSVYVYEGKSPVTYDYYMQVYGELKVIMDNFHMDHISPVDPVDGTMGKPGVDYNWTLYYSRLFCPEENFQGICKECHDKKSKTENKERRLNKNSRTKGTK